MKFLLDSHLLVWSAANSRRLPRAAYLLLADNRHTFIISVVSLWEIAIKSSLNKPGFRVDADRLRQQSLLSGFIELAIQSPHAMATSALPRIHRDPFDRMLVAQAMVERLTLLTVDRTLARYGSLVRLV